MVSYWKTWSLVLIMGLGVMRRLWNPSTVGLSQNCIDTDASC